MNPVEVIRKKRNGEKLAKRELEEFITGYVEGTIPDYQMSAFLMAVYFRGMTDEETSTFTEVMLYSGEVIDLSTIPGIKVDKHSTGGVGDKISLILAPMVAACGVPVPMISGRGLGHTGGTLDKLESIPGFRTDISVDEYKRLVAEVGMALIGQTRQVAPADKRMYALRDVSATVESIPLIAGSIMSKKLAEGIDALVLDVKTGDGAFMRTYEHSVALATTLVSIGTRFGKNTVAFITDMNQPLGFAIGNWLEVLEAIECLRGKTVPDVEEVTTVLGGAMLQLGGKAGNIEEGTNLCRSALQSGKAYEKFADIVKRQGGDIGMIEHPQKYPQSKFVSEVKSSRNGYVNRFESMRIGLLAAELGAGRQRMDDVIDPKAGIVLRKKLGDPVVKGETLAIIHTDRHSILENASVVLASCIQVEGTPGPRQSCILSYVDERGAAPWATPATY